MPTEAQWLARQERAEFFLAYLDALACVWDPKGGLDDDTFGASWDDEAWDDLGGSGAEIIGSL